MKSANIMIRLLAGMLAAMTVFSVVACGKIEDPSETTTAPVGEVTTDAATVMEAIASEDYRTVAPFYYDQYLKLRYSNNDIGVEIYDIIRNSVFIDFGRISAVNLGILETVFRNAVQSGTNKVASSLKAESRIWDRKLNTILDAYAERQGQ
jgi:hypothetical protein